MLRLLALARENWPCSQALLLFRLVSSHRTAAASSHCGVFGQRRLLFARTPVSDTQRLGLRSAAEKEAAVVRLQMRRYVAASHPSQLETQCQEMRTLSAQGWHAEELMAAPRDVSLGAFRRRGHAAETQGTLASSRLGHAIAARFIEGLAGNLPRDRESTRPPTKFPSGAAHITALAADALTLALLVRREAAAPIALQHALG